MAAAMATQAHEAYTRDGELRPQHSRDNSRDSGIFHTTKGLWNAPGLNNCFLNSAVQVSEINHFRKFNTESHVVIDKLA